MATFGLLAGCQALAPADAVVTIQQEPVRLDLEIATLQKAAATDDAQLVATVAAASTQVVEHSLMNAALGATLRANYTATPAVRAVVVSAEDMGSSLDMDMMDDMSYDDATDSTFQISGLDTARGVNANSGCSTGSVKQFGTDEAQIYATARVTNLQEGTYFEIDWIQQNRVLSRPLLAGRLRCANIVHLVLCYSRGFCVLAGQLHRDAVCQRHFSSQHRLHCFRIVTGGLSDTRARPSKTSGSFTATTAPQAETISRMSLSYPYTFHCNTCLSCLASDSADRRKQCGWQRT